MNLDRFSDAEQSLLQSGGSYELQTANVRGTESVVFANAPRHLRDFFSGALAHSNDTFYVYEDERYTFGEAWDQSQRAAAALQALGVKPGDRVGIAMRNYPEWVFAFMGITSLGAVAVAMNAWWSSEEMLYGIADSGLKTLFADKERLEQVWPHLDQQHLTAISVRTEHSEHNRVVTWGNFTAEQAPHNRATPLQLPDIEPDANATILYTSGSTSHPKGVVSSHRAIIHSVLGWEAAAALARATAGRPPRPRERQPCMILTVPLFHVTGLNGQLLPSLRNGRKVVGMHKWDAEKALALIEREQVTHFSGVPSMAYELVNSPNYEAYDLSTLRSIGGGGAAMTPKHSERIAQRSKNRARASAAYGMTETNGLAASNAGDNLKARPESCGRALPPLVEIQVKSSTGEALPAGATGEICIKGPMNFTEYWNRPEDTASAVINGWLHTGDIGHMDNEGYIFITDRAKDMIIRGGENIGCPEVEAALYEHPNVMECAVFGLPDERLGECVAAVVRVTPGAIFTPGDLRSHVSSRLARFKVPEKIWIQETELPRTASGKIYKRGLQERACQHLLDTAALTAPTRQDPGLADATLSAG